MSFSPEWLALREGADHAARNKGVLADVGRHFAGTAPMTIVDLGAGTGSNLRGMFHALPRDQHWHLVDYDPALLAAAHTTLSEWAGHASQDGEVLQLVKAGRTLRVSFQQLDLNGSLLPILDLRPHLVTAAAFFDLVSPEWITRFVRALTGHSVAFYTALTYNGLDSWQPDHAGDRLMLEAFCQHQQTDKGFGPAAGPHAHRLMADAFRGAGYKVSEGSSPWRLGPDDKALMGQLVAGFAGAVRETGQVEGALIDDWLRKRLDAKAMVTGHDDLFARKMG